ncbi:MAG: endolytic transglycosylase MltG [Desulfuromonadales bacterium]|nr:endolytic transglycosylase MltG [Desulfuromonadales bacterium]
MRRLLLVLIILIVLLSCGLALGGWWLLTTPVTPPETVTLEVTPGSSLQRVARQLEEQGVISHALLLRLLAKWHDQEQQIQAGHYTFALPATAENILQRLVRGDVDRVNLTIPEGFNLQQIIERIVESGHGEAARLWQLARDQEFIASLGIDADSLEGYLFPETYHFVPGTTEAALLRMMVEQFQLNLSAEKREAARQLGLSLHQHVTLASLIEKETGVVAEMPLISSVFHNRLAINMRLQTDPTVIYGVEDYSGTITRRHLNTPTPYNTYIIYGLPPGPIASPGRPALYAAVFPETSDYYYFVSRGDGSHHFSRTLREHNNAVQKYLRNGR